MLVEEDRSWELVEHRTVQVWEVEEMVCEMVVEVWWILVGEGQSQKRHEQIGSIS